MGTETGMHEFSLATTYPTLASDEGPPFGDFGVATISPGELLQKRQADLIRLN